MKTFVPFLFLFFLSINAGAQLISRFTWETNPTTAIYGPNAISVSSYATVSTGATSSTKGLNPGAGSYDINLVLDGSIFNLPAIDIAVDFRREESQASFFYRGTNFNFGMNGGSLSVNFMVTNGTTNTTVNSGNVFSVPDDHAFHNYRFVYDNNTGVAKMWADAVLVYTYNGTAGNSLYWTGAGNVTVGKDMDATGKNVAILDNLVVQKYANAILPLSLISFTAEAKSKFAVINWNTTQELNVTSFTIERSSNGATFSSIKTIPAANRYDVINRYQFTDGLSLSTVSYYRLKMTNNDGSYTYSAIKSVTVDAATSAEISLFPNPAVDYVTIKMNNARAAQFHYNVLSITGLVIVSADVQVNSGVQQIKIDLTKTALRGAMLIQFINKQTNAVETFTIVKK